METTNFVANYYDAVAKGYDNLYFDSISQAENAIVKDWFIQAIKQSEKKVRILDLGCGTGLGLEFLKDLDESMYEYIGVDISLEMILEAKKKFYNKPDAIFLLGDMANLSNFQDNSFDIVTSFFGSFSHVPKFLSGMKEINRVLKPHGKTFLMVYSRYSFRAIIDFVFRRRKGAIDFKQEYNIRNNNTMTSCKAFFYSPCVIRRLLEKSNFRRIKSKGLNVFFEVGFFKSMLKRFDVNIVRKILEKESFYFRNHTLFAHSLITIAEKM
jgi:ubiquinone/menaquinone biosynthesis C-methylase UbiE